MMPSRTALKKTLFEAAAAASEILLAHFGKIRAFHHKGDVDIVTVADKKSEEAVMRIIHRAFPDHDILAEESGATSAKEGASSDYRWVIDPLDGTSNFAHSIPIFSVSIAVQQKDETILGLVVDPTRNEWFFAEKGKGAWLMAGAKGKRRRMHCASCRELNNAIVLTGLPHNRREILQPLLDTLGHMIQNTHGILRLGSAAIDLSWVACGRGACFYEPHLMPWDFAAGALLVREAGGLSTNFEGKPLTIEDRQVFCSAPHVHKNLLRLIRKTWN